MLLSRAQLLRAAFSDHLKRTLREQDTRQSLSCKVHCLDNTVDENLFGLLKRELLKLQAFQVIEHFNQTLLDDLNYCNNRSIKAKRKSLPPVLHRQQALQLLEQCVIDNPA